MISIIELITTNRQVKYLLLQLIRITYPHGDRRTPWEWWAERILLTFLWFSICTWPLKN